MAPQIEQWIVRAQPLNHQGQKNPDNQPNSHQKRSRCEKNNAYITVPKTGDNELTSKHYKDVMTDNGTDYQRKTSTHNEHSTALRNSLKEQW